MAVRILQQKDYLEMEATIDPKTSVAEVHELLRAMKTNARLIILYNGGSVQAINVEQYTKMSDAKSDQVREMLGVKSQTFSN